MFLWWCVVDNREKSHIKRKCFIGMFGCFSFDKKGLTRNLLQSLYSFPYPTHCLWSAAIHSANSACSVILSNSIVFSISLLLLKNGWTALMIASHQGHLDVAKMLVDHGAEIDARNEVSLKRIKMEGVSN